MFIIKGEIQMTVQIPCTPISQYVGWRVSLLFKNIKIVMGQQLRLEVRHTFFRQRTLIAVQTVVAKRRKKERDESVIKQVWCQGWYYLQQRKHAIEKNQEFKTILWEGVPQRPIEIKYGRSLWKKWKKKNEIVSAL